MLIEGRNPINEAIMAERSIEKIMIARGEHDNRMRKLIKRAKDNKIIIQEVDKRKLDQLSETENHQGVIAIASEYEYCSVEDILSYANEKNENPFVIILDEITDPHNLGAIIRTANIAGAHGIIIPERRSAGLTQIVAKTSAGALEYTRVAKVKNLNNIIKELKDKGIWIYTADMDGKVMYDEDLKGPMALIIGSEGKGVSRLVKENSDFILKIPMYGDINSLNASVSAGVLMYEVVRQRRK